MTQQTVSPIPNAITAGRLVAGLVMFLLMLGSAGAIPFVSEGIPWDAQMAMRRWAFVVFIFAAVTDFFDGYLARKLKAESRWGAILDPIADKILVCGTILGLFAMGAQPIIALPVALILFREFAVSALREAAAGKGATIPVSLLAKWKTTIQLVALGTLILSESWSSFSDSGIFGHYTPFVFAPVYEVTVFVIANWLIWIAAGITVWTGAAYFIAAKHDI